MKRIIAATILALAWLPAFGQGGLRMDYDTTRTAVSQRGSGPPTETVTREPMTAWLMPAALVVRQGDQQLVYDFASRRAYQLDDAKQISREHALYAIPGFIEHEIVNREAMTRVAAALGISKDVDMVDAESQLSMTQEKPAKVKLKEEKSGDTRTFLLNGRAITVLAPAATAIPAALRPTFEKLLIYKGALHPRVRALVVADGRLPQRLEFRWREIGERNSVTWELRGTSEETVDVAALLAKYPRKPMEEKGLPYRAWQVVHGELGTAPAVAQYLERAERLLVEGRGLEALLVTLECSYATGAVDDELLTRTYAAAGTDARATAVLRAIQIETKGGDSKEALAQLGSVSPEGLEGAAAIHVMRAIHQLRLKRGDYALPEFERALALNPFMVGPWMDAGRVYYGSYRTVSAWNCWEAVRAFAPGNAALKDVDELEASLARRHPEFF